MRLELEAGDDAEVAAAAAQGPEEVGILRRARAHLLSVGEHDVDCTQRVDGEAVPPHEPADAAAQRQASDPRVRDLACRDREPVLLRHGVELAEQGSAPDPDDCALGVDLDAVQRPQVDAERAVANGAAGDRVRAGPDGERKPLGAGGANRGGDVVGIRRVGDGGRATVDGPVPAGTGGVVLGIGRLDDAADEAAGAKAGGDGDVIDGCHDATIARIGKYGVGGLPHLRPLSRAGGASG